MIDIIEATFLNGNFKGEYVLFLRNTMIPNSNRSDFRIQTFVVSRVTYFCNDHQHSTRTIAATATSVWNEF